MFFSWLCVCIAQSGCDVLANPPEDVHPEAEDIAFDFSDKKPLDVYHLTIDKSKGYAYTILRSTWALICMCYLAS